MDRRRPIVQEPDGRQWQRKSEGLRQSLMGEKYD